MFRKKKFECVMGVEPTFLPWEGSIIAVIRYTHLFLWALQALNLRPSD